MIVRLARCARASAGIHLVLVTGALLTTTILTFELVRYVQLQNRAERAVVTIADYASRQPTVDCRQVRALAQFVQAEMLGANASGLLALTSAIGDPTEERGFAEDWTWEPPFVLGPADIAPPVERCRDGLARRRGETLAALAMVDGEAVVVAQLCLAPDEDDLLTPGWLRAVITSAIYRQHVLPIRAASLQQVCA